MSYLVLARKYRPQRFSDVAGQEHVVRTLQNAIAADRVAHAFLFTGARGVGKTTSARLLAKALQCERGPTPEPCGECTPCREIAAGNSTDVLEIDGASNNGVDQVRELRENARYLPSRDRFKIYIIDEVHMLSGAAFNALLKTLEEPPPHVKFLFATTEPHKIPVTILSRTQRFDLRRIPLKTVVERLMGILRTEGIGLSERAVTLVARQAEGSMRDGLSLLDQVVSAVAGGESGVEVPDETVEEILGAIDRSAVARLGGALIDGDGATALEVVAGVFDRGLDLARLAEDLAWHLRNLMVTQVGGRASGVLDVPDHERVELEAQAQRADPATLAFLFDVVQAAVPEVGRAIQPRLTLEVALMKAIHLAPATGLNELLERVEALAGGRPRPPRGGGPDGPGARRPAPARGRPSPGPALQAAPAQTRVAPPAAPAPAPAAPAPAPAAPPTQPASVETLEPPPQSDRFGARAARILDKVEALQGGAPDGPSAPEPPPPDAPPPGAWEAPASAASAPAAAPRVNPEPPPEPMPAPEPPPEPPSPEPPPAPPKAPAKAPSKAAQKPKAASAAPKADPARAEDPDDGGVVNLPAGDDPAADLATRYTGLVEAVSAHAEKPFIMAALEHARPLELGEAGLAVAVPRGLYLDGLGSAANRRVLERLVSDHFGRPMEVRLEPADAVKLDGVPEAIATVKEREAAERVERLRAEALANPSVRVAVEALGGEIEDIRIVGG